MGLELEHSVGDTELERKLGLKLEPISITGKRDGVYSTTDIYVTPLAKKYFETVKRKNAQKYDSRSNATVMLGRVVNFRAKKNSDSGKERQMEIDQNTLKTFGIKVEDIENSKAIGPEHCAINIGGEILRVSLMNISREYENIKNNKVKESTSIQKSMWHSFCPELDIERIYDEMNKLMR